MISLDENALVCDLAETYQLYDYRSLPAKTVAALSAGLRETSRIRTRMRGGQYYSQEILLAFIYDLFHRWIVGENVPLIQESILGSVAKEAKASGIQTYDSTEAFDQARRKILGEE